ncbi:MAG: YHS domain-containing (seleno)protein [Beijerinckiaceae bacterium]
MRNIRHPIRTGLWLICGAIAAATAPLVASVRSPDPAAQMIHDPRTGLAMFGYDAVAFLSDAKALPGKPELSAYVGGHVWRFTTAANRAAFVAAPESYIPLFGGHDARGVADGRMVAGDPATFLIVGGRTTFFRTADDRDAFASDEALRRKAIENGPRVAAQLAGH